MPGSVQLPTFTFAWSRHWIQRVCMALLAIYQIELFPIGLLTCFILFICSLWHYFQDVISGEFWEIHLSLAGQSWPSPLAWVLHGQDSKRERLVQLDRSPSLEPPMVLRGACQLAPISLKELESRAVLPQRGLSSPQLICLPQRVTVNCHASLAVSDPFRFLAGC